MHKPLLVEDRRVVHKLSKMSTQMGLESHQIFSEFFFHQILSLSRHCRLKRHLNLFESDARKDLGHESMTKSVWEMLIIKIIDLPPWLKKWFKVGLSKQIFQKVSNIKIGHHFITQGF